MAVWGGQDNSLESEDTGGAGRVVKGKKKIEVQKALLHAETYLCCGN